VRHPDREFGLEGSSAIGGHSLGDGLRIVAFVPDALVDEDLLGERVAAYGDTMPRLATSPIA
jgi:hypothetical protein